MGASWQHMNVLIRFLEGRGAGAVGALPAYLPLETLGPAGGFLW